MDRIFAHGIEVACIIGTHPQERAAPQELIVDLELETDCSTAGASDNLEDSVDYERLTSRVRELASQSACHLLETLAEQLAKQVLASSRRIAAVLVRVTKPGALPGTLAVGVEIRRSRRGCRQ